MDGYVQIGTELDTKDFDKQYAELTKRVLEIEKRKIDIQLESRHVEETSEQFEKLTKESEELENELTDIYLKLGSITYGKSLQEMENGTGRVAEGFKSVGGSLQDAVKKAGKLVIGIFAIRSAYQMLSRTSSDLASYDKEYASNLEYIRYVLTEAIAPVLKWIIQLASTLLNYLFQILNAWFGLNLGKGAKDFEAMKKSSGGVAKNMKEAGKATQGFDELNVLQDNSQTSGGGGGGYTAPTLDLSGMQGEPPAWLQWIIDNKELVLGALGAILGAIIAIKTGLSGFAGLGIGLAIAGIVSLIGDLTAFIKDPTWENFGKVLTDIGMAITGVGIALMALGMSGPIPMIIGLITMLVGEIIKHWDEIQKVLGPIGQWIYDHVIKPVGDFFAGLWEGIQTVFSVVGQWFHDVFTGAWNAIVGVFQGLGQWFAGVWNGVKQVFSVVGEFFKNIFTNAWNAITNIFKNIGNFFQGIWNTIVGIFSKIGQRIGEAVSGAFKGAVNAIFTVLENILNAPIRAINGLISLINMIPGVNLGKLQEFHLPRLKTGGIINMPNKGTMVGGSAIGGESGREGVIPLTDSQAMETLGESIGKYVTINATINNTMDGKLISRHIQKIQNQQAFAGNL